MAFLSRRLALKSNRRARKPSLATLNITGELCSLPARKTGLVQFKPAPYVSAPSAAGSTVYGYNAQKNRLLSAGALGYTYDNEGQLTNAGSTCLSFGNRSPAKRRRAIHHGATESTEEGKRA